MKPSPPAFCIGMNAEDYDWKNHRHVATEDGLIAVSLFNDQKHVQQGEEQMATKPIAKKAAAPVAAKKAPAAKAPATKEVAKAVVAKEKPAKEKAPKEPRETFASEAVALMKEGKLTDEQIVDKLFDKFPNTPAVIGALRWHRWKYNSKAKKEGLPLLAIVGSKKPVAGEKKAAEKKSAAPAPKATPAKAAAKPVAAAPVKKTVIKKA